MIGTRFHVILLFVGIFTLLVAHDSHAQPGLSRPDYIKQYAGIAMDEMRAYGIPASIKLAQALLESDNGNSLLSSKAHNHFGIKCHKEWTGPVFHKDDDEKDECFRSYRRAEDSFRDHSLFLRDRSRYNALFSLKPDDYAGWAHGLKQAGYATNPRYAHMLIKIIEDNDLSRYDNLVLQGEGYIPVSISEPKRKRERKQQEDDFDPLVLGQARIKYEVNGASYIMAGPGDRYALLAKEFDLAEWMIRSFNEVDRRREPKEGERVYIEPKKRRGEQTLHISDGKVSLWGISMMHGVRVKNLEKWNAFTREQLPPYGVEIKLRK